MENMNITNQAWADYIADMWEMAIEQELPTDTEMVTMAGYYGEA